MNYVTVPDIAKRYKVSQGRIWQIAKERRIRPAARVARIALWTSQQVAKLAPTSAKKGTKGSKRPARKARSRR